MTSVAGWKHGTSWSLFGQIAPKTALELVKYQSIICQLFLVHSAAAALKYDKLFRQAAARNKKQTLPWDALKENLLVWCITNLPFRTKPQSHTNPWIGTSTGASVHMGTTTGSSHHSEHAPTPHQARRSVEGSTLEGAPRGQNVPSPISARSQAVVGITLPRPCTHATPGAT